jgi:hypothetical protein
MSNGVFHSRDLSIYLYQAFEQPDLLAGQLLPSLQKSQGINGVKSL